MGSKYQKNINPVNDIFLDMMMSGYDFSSKKSHQELYSMMLYVLEGSLYNESDMRFLEFDIKTQHNGSLVKIVPDNIICALWFSGIIVENTSKVVEENKFVFDNKSFSFNKKRKVLKVAKIK